jgi:hypothetical protein
MCTVLGLWVSHIYTFLSLQEIAGVLSGMLVSKQAMLIFVHQYWLASTISGLTFMIAGRIAATRFLNRPTSVWHCMRDVMMHGVGTASAFGLFVAPFKLIDMLFRRAHSTNRFFWRICTNGKMCLPFELEAGFLILASLEYNAIRAGHTILFHYMAAVYYAVIISSLYSIQRLVVWILEQFHKVSTKVYPPAILTRDASFR